MSGLVRGTAMLIAAATGSFFAAGAAQAEYFIRPVLQYNGATQDGLDRNGATSGQQTFYDSGTRMESFVDLGEGTIKTYLGMTGPDTGYGIVTGIMGEQIRYFGPSDVPVSFKYDFDFQVFADQYYTGTPPEFDNRTIAVQAYFAVYEAGSGATWDDWTEFGTNYPKALYVDSMLLNYESYGENISLWDSGSLGTDLLLHSGGYYDVFAAFNLIVSPGAMTGEISMDALHTSTIGIDAPTGSTITSQSGQFLGYAQTPGGAVPEPATWAMMIGGFALVGAGMRRRKVAIAFA